MKQHARTTDSTAITSESSNLLPYQCLESLLNSIAYHPPWHWIRMLLQALQTSLGNGEHPYRLSQRILRKRCSKQLPLSPLTPEEAQTDLRFVKQLRYVIRQHNRVPGSQKLDPYQQEIHALCQVGASLRDIRYWLMEKRHMRVSVSTLQRYIKSMTNAQASRTC